MAGYPSRWRPSLSRAGVLLRSWAAEEAEYGHLFYWVPVFMGMGAVFWFSASRTPSAIQVGLLLLLFLAGALLLRYRRPLFGMVCGALAMLCLGALSAAWESESAATVILDSPVTTTLTAVVTEREAVAGGRWRYGLDVIATEKPRLKRAPLRVTLTASAGKTPLGLGDRVRGRARLLTPSGPALAGLNDFGFDAYFSGSGAIGFFYGSPDKVEMNIAPSSSVYRSFRLFIEGLRGGISARIRSVLPGDTGAFAASMITDDRRAIGKETTEALRLAGLTHIVAISGLNMALAAGIFFVGIRALLSLSQTIAHRYPVKKIAAAGALVTVTGYYLISGFAVSAERAYIMMAIMLVAAMMGRPSISLRNVALSALVILALSPSAVMGPGFQMSFAATLALVTGYSVWQRRTDNRPNPAMPGFLKPIAAIWTFAFGIFATSLIGGLSTALFSIGHFHRIAVWGLPANLLAMPIISLVVMPAGLAALILMPVGLDWLPLKAMGIGLDLVIAIAKWAASLGGDVVTGRIAGWLFVGLSACLLVLAIMRSPLRLAGLAAGILLLLSNAFMPAAPRPDIVVHEDGRLAGLVTGDAIASTASRPAAFVFEQWLRALPARNHLKPVLKEALPRSHDRKPFDEAEKRAETALLDADLDSMPAGRFLCRVGRWCAARAWNGSRIIVMERRELVGRACDRADLVVTPARLRWRACRSGAMLLSAETLRRSGTMEIWLDPENIRQFRVISVLGDIDRPWYAHRTYDWRSGEFVGKGSQSTE
ncbi:MAG: ComEC/Rec2 family competence protein [Rhizobiaceae bacterium]|nr:ComEC/Rec2 family competence protein [Rhizobiaceae bacterium]